MSWGRPNKRWVRSKIVEALPELGCHLCFAMEKIFSGCQGTFLLQHHSPDFKCGCQHYSAVVRVTQHDLATPCETHVAMMAHVMKLYDEFLERMTAARLYSRAFPAYGVELRRPPDGAPTITILDHWGDARKSYGFVLRNPPNASVTYEDTAINTSWIDLNLATMWKTRCANHHGSKCHDPDKTASMAPDWLIDTKRNCLVRGEPLMEFVALSYCWGTSLWSRVGLDKLDELRKPGGLSNSSITKLPIIRDAMHVVRNINERYLWIDAVCIIHDDKDHLAHQLQHMEAIYASAKLTIMATDGDSMTGLPGLQGCSAPRDLGGVFPWTNNREIFVRELPSLSYIHLPGYFKRGWTLQEHILSPRRLIFNKQQIHWTCAAGSWHEDLPYAPSPTNKANETLVRSTKILRRRPDLDAFDSLIRSYYNLEVNYPDDAPPGLAGLLGLISPSFQGGLLFGLPVMCFEAALLWGSKFFYANKKGKSKRLQRREHSNKLLSPLPDADLPSWSWIGWKSDCFTLFKDEEDYQVITYPDHSYGMLPRSEKWVTIPTTQWFCHDTPTSTTKYPIQSSWFKPHKETPDPPNLPKGWVRGKYLSANGLDAANFRSIPLGITGEYVYHHPEFPDRLFWRPFPVSADEQGATPSQMKQCKYISCKTKRSWFPYLRKEGYTMDAGAMDYHLQLLDQRDQICGWIQLTQLNAALPRHRESRFVALNEFKREKRETLAEMLSIPSDGSLDLVVELVVVCRRYFSESVNYDHHQWLDRRAYRPFYGVLCIEWVSGIAYRIGYGYVSKRAFDQHDDVEDVDLVLG